MTTPWKCGTCKRLVKYKVDYCPGCGGHWTATQDATYSGMAMTPKSPRRAKSPRGSRQNQWETWNWDDSWDPQQWPAIQPKSPRTRGGFAKGKGKGKDQSKSKDKGKAKEPDWTPPNFNIGATTSSAPKEAQESGQYKQLLSLLRQKQQDLPPEVQSALQATQIADSKNITKQLHSAVSQLGSAKKQLTSLAQARTQLHQSWTTFIKESVERWKQYAEDFQEQDAKIVAQIQEASQKLQVSQDNFQQCQQKASEAGGPPTEVIELETDEELPDMSGSVEKNMQEMVSSLDGLASRMELEEHQGKKRKVEASAALPAKDGAS